MATVVSTKGQVVIPRKVRQVLGIAPGSKVDFDVRGNVVEMRVVKKKIYSRLEDGYGMAKIKGKMLPDNFDVSVILEKSKK